MTWEDILKKSLKEEYLDYERLFSSSQYGSEEYYEFALPRMKKEEEKVQESR